jgi:hypothetical protein
MANDFDKEPDGDRQEREKRERQRAETDAAARSLAEELRSSTLISDSNPRIEVSANGQTVMLRNITAPSHTMRIECMIGGGWNVQTQVGMSPFPAKDAVVSEVRAWVHQQQSSR